MLLSTPILLAFSAKAAAFCRTPRPSESFKAVHAECAQANTSVILTARAVPVYIGFKPVVINTYVHVIYSQKGSVTTGNILAAQITQQITALNTAFAGSGFTFKLVSTTRWGPNTPKYKSNWLNLEEKSQSETDMKTTLRKGSYKDLNIYFTTLKSTEDNIPVLGWAYFPEHVNKKGEITDGVVVATNTQPGGTNKYHGSGKVAVHEVGHWLGLLHTFEASGSDPDDGCVGGGDYVSDTPAEKTAATGCPKNRNTCSRAAGSHTVDPVHNYMDHTTSACMTQFTNGQKARMQAMWVLYRANYEGPYEKGIAEVDDGTTGDEEAGF